MYSIPMYYYANKQAVMDSGFDSHLIHGLEMRWPIYKRVTGQEPMAQFNVLTIATLRFRDCCVGSCCQ